MKQLIILSLFLVVGTLDVRSQKLNVTSFQLVGNDPAATQYPVKYPVEGGSTKLCALIIVGLAVDGIEFEGNIIKQEHKPNGEYWVYVIDGTMEFQINSKDYLPELVEFSSFGINSVESGRTYRMTVEHPNLEKSFDELLEIARKYYKEYPAHIETSYYDAARIAYDNAINHNDCPHDLREKIREERDTMASIRRNTYLIEAADAKAKQFEKEKGFECDEVYKYLGGEVRFADRILQYHPEITGIQTLKDSILERLKQHPKGKKEDGTEVVVRQREKVSGTVTFKNKYMQIPFEKMRVFGINCEKIQNGKSHIIGKVNADGTYSVVKPTDIQPLYIYVTGEKNNAHFVAEGVTNLDIVVK